MTAFHFINKTMIFRHPIFRIDLLKFQIRGFHAGLGKPECNTVDALL